jgi:hypothetical protein
MQLVLASSPGFVVVAAIMWHHVVRQCCGTLLLFCGFCCRNAWQILLASTSLNNLPLQKNDIASGVTLQLKIHFHSHLNYQGLAVGTTTTKKACQYAWKILLASTSPNNATIYHCKKMT